MTSIPVHYVLQTSDNLAPDDDLTLRYSLNLQRKTASVSGEKTIP